ncbi:NUDIX hydrolase [Pseudomonas sp. NPDC089422]|uniref:NUDIX hydrolase n=1 Tax=Pseudomonas sp. NPDC089422 TaxID=3364466 RepID=UPI003804A9C4
MGYEKDRKLKARATIICLKGGKILLVRKRSGKWNFPGGAIEAGETAIEAAARELREETSIAGHSLLSLCTVRVGNTVHHVFTTQLHDDVKPVACNEITACKWVPRNKLDSSLLKTTAAGLIETQLPALIA